MKLISKEVSQAEPEYMNIHTPISVLATALMIRTFHEETSSTNEALCSSTMGDKFGMVVGMVGSLSL